MFDLLNTYSDIFLYGIWLTLKINFLAVLFGLPFSLVLFAGRTSKSYLTKSISTIFIEFFKGMPALVLMFWLYLCLPLIFELRLSAEFAATLTLGINYSVNASEVFRSSWRSVSKELSESLSYFGLPKTSAVMLFEGPMLLKASLPGLLALLAATVKLSAVAAFIGVPEIFHATQSAIQQTYRPVALYTLLAVFYLILVSIITFFEKLLTRNSEV